MSWQNTMTAVSTTAVAGFAALWGAGWAVYRYRRAEPDLPRIDASVHANLQSIDGADYLHYEVTVKHLGGAKIFIKDDPEPTVQVLYISKSGKPSPRVLHDRRVLKPDNQLCGGESTYNEGIFPLERRESEAIGYEVRFIFKGGIQGRPQRLLRLLRAGPPDRDQSWEWKRNTIVAMQTTNYARPRTVLPPSSS
jgi:hypothetical protein